MPNDPGACDPGTTTTEWASECPTAPPKQCTAGDWIAAGPDPDHSNFELLSESEHFAVYSDESPEGAQEAVDHLESVWKIYFGSPIFMREPLCDEATKYKVSIHVHSDWGLTGGAWDSKHMGMWIGTGGLEDHWGLAHEFAHGVQSVAGGLVCNDSNTCGWIYESHANFMAHQQAEYRADEHCSELSVNAPHLYLGSTRDRYCNWQFMEFLKDRFCFDAVNAIWTSDPSNDPFTSIMKYRNWDIERANDFYGEWAMHNVTWDYQDPEPKVDSDVDPAAAFRMSYGQISDQSRTERRLRLTELEPLDDQYPENRRFFSPFYWAPQRYGYNVIELFPDAGATEVRVSFRGVVDAERHSDWRWGLLAANSELTSARYGALQKGSDGEAGLCVADQERVFLVVLGSPSEQLQITWDQAYTTIPRYPYMVQFEHAWPAGFQGGALADCPADTTRVKNGGGCGPADLPDSVYVGPYARVLGGKLSGDVQILDHATVVNGNLTGGTIGALSVIGMSGFNGNGFDVSGDAIVKTTFYPLGFFEPDQSILGSATLLGDVELRGQGFALQSGAYSGIVSDSEHADVGDDVSLPPPYTWR